MKKICIDIDGVIATELDEGDWKYERCVYIAGSREVILSIKALGYAICLFSARWEIDRDKTIEWLQEHNIYYDELILGKPKADIYVDDRALRFMGDWNFILQEIREREKERI